MMDSAWYVFGVLPVLIFLARVTDVSIGTMRILFVVRGSRLLAALLGFLEVFLWIIIIGQIFGGQNTGLLHYFAYAAGFATGNYVGILIESNLALGLQTIRVITGAATDSLERELLARGFSATHIDATGLRGGRMSILFSTLKRRHVPVVLQLIERHLPRAFVSIEDVRSIKSGHLPMTSEFGTLIRLFPFGRKGK